MTVRFHLFPFRTQKLSSLVPKIVRWKRRVKIGSRRLLYGPLVKRLRQRPLTPLTSVRFRYGSPYAPLAQLVEQLTLNQWAQGSSPWRCTNKRALNRMIRRSFSMQKSGCTLSAHRLHICPNQGLFCARLAQPAFLCIKMELVGARPLHLLSQTVLSLKHPTGVFVASQTRRR